MISRKFPLMPLFSSFLNSPSCQMESKAFWKSMKQAYSFFPFLSDTYLLTSVLSVNIWSDVLVFLRNPICSLLIILFFHKIQLSDCLELYRTILIENS